MMPRVAPRMPIEAMVDTTKHPPKRTIRTRPEDPDANALHWTSVVALYALVVFWVLVFVAGLLLAATRFAAAAGSILAAGGTLIVHYRIEAE